MFEFSDAAGPLSGSGPKYGQGAIWFHDNIRVPGVGPNGTRVEIRTHSANPNAPDGSYSQSNYTTQVNSSQNLYMLPDNTTWDTMNNYSQAQRAQAHMPAGN